ncbi:MAG: UDP-glucose 4-epimerase [Rhodothalassiaceae bacterium]|nr:MAG: UDP-glucose 4-epimerase [Rhodothalassiaceae bacterium]
MIVLITGARGFIGRHVSRALAADGDCVLGIGHGDWPSAREEAGLALWLNADVSLANLRLVCREFGAPDVVVHLAGGSSVGAALANPLEDFRRTVVSTAELLEWMRHDAPQARLVALSSAAVYGEGHEGRIPESAPLRPVSPYGYHKAVSESLCRMYAKCYNLSISLLRPFSVFGPGLRKQLIWDLCTRLRKGENIIKLGGTGRETRDWLYVEDLVQAVKLAIPEASAEAPVFNAGTGKAITVQDFSQAVIEIFGLSSKVVNLVFTGEERAGDPRNLVSDIRKIKERGFNCGWTLRDGIKEYVNWFNKCR